MTFLTRQELDNLNDWVYAVQDNGILSKLYNPLYEAGAKLMPRTVSPNVITFTGLLFSIYAYYYSTLGNDLYHNVVSATCIIIYMVLDAIDGKHARNNMMSSSLGELVDHFCDCITNVLLVTTFCNVYGIGTDSDRWMLIVYTQICFLKEHAEAMYAQDKKIVFDKFTGPTEVLTALIVAIYVRSFVVNPCTFVWVVTNIIRLQAIYSLYKIYKLTSHDSTDQNFSTSLGFTFCIAIQVTKYCTTDLSYYIENGIILSTICADIILCKMANRDLHQLIPVMQLVALLVPSLSIPLALAYFVINVRAIANNLQIPIISPITNVLVLGFYDGFHIAHQLSLIKASRLGTSLIVGVHSQEDLVEKLEKRGKGQKPNVANGMMRFQAVSNFRYVTKTIYDCPQVITEEFIRKHKIHIVGISEEYVDEFDDAGNPTKVGHWYQVPLEMGILRVVKRTQGISSSELRKLNVENKTKEELENITRLLTELVSQSH